MCPIKNISSDSKHYVVRPLPIILALYIIGIIYGKFISINLIFLFSIIILLILISIISFAKQWNITT
ncbi:unnamed protein product, partial [marine sediment metagenome]